MMHNLAEVSEKLRERLTALYGARLVRLILYGSQARGDAGPGSDVDVLVVLQGPLSPCEEIDRTLDDLGLLLGRAGCGKAACPDL